MSERQDSRVSGRLGLPAAIVIALVLAVSAGIVGMHHLGGGGHHSMDAMSEHAAASTMGSTPEHTVAAAPSMRTVDDAVVTAAVTATSSLKAATGGDSMLSACVTALLGGLLGLLVYLTLGWRARRQHDPSSLLVRTDRPRLGRGPPRDLLAQLCVLRT